MVVLRFIFIIIVALAVVSCSQFGGKKFITDGAYTMESFDSLHDSLQSDDDIIQLYTEFMDNADDIDLLRNVQNNWEEMDHAGALAYSKKNAESDDKSALKRYLYGRVVESPVEKINIGRKTIELDPNFSYGYRLVLATYSQDVFNGKESDEEYQQLATMLNEDKELFSKFVEVDSEEIYAYQVLFDYQIYSRDFEGAQTTLDKAAALEQRWPSSMQTATVLAGLGEFDKAKNMVKEYLTGQVDDAELNDYVDMYYARALFDVKNYDEIIRYKKAVKGYREDADKLYDLACVYSLKGDNENAISYLTEAANKGWDNIKHTQKDSDLESLHEAAGWTEAIATIQSNWDSGKEDRKKEALAEKVDEEAPSWNLEDINGQMVSLEDQKGKVIILDFWATWCGPCRLAMPVLDEYIKNRAPENVEIFSINVWEKGKSKPVKFLEKHGYAMTLLYGNDKIVEDYGFRGIPYLCVIDQNGKIRFTHSGYSDGLDELLDFWVQDLM